MQSTAHSTRNNPSTPDKHLDSSFLISKALISHHHLVPTRRACFQDNSSHTPKMAGRFGGGDDDFSKKICGMFCFLVLTVFAWLGLYHLIGMLSNPIRAAGFGSSFSPTHNNNELANKRFVEMCRVHIRWTSGRFEPVGPYIERRIYHIVEVPFPYAQWSWPHQLDEA